MLNVALVGLLAGSLAIGGGDSKNPQAGEKPAADNAVPGIFTPSADAPLSPAVSPETVQDTYAFGIADRNSPIRIWAQYAYGEAEGTYDPDGDTQEIVVAGAEGDIVSQRGAFGAELGLPVGLFGFGLGVGGQLTIAKNEFQVGENNGRSANNTNPLGTGNIDSDFGLQNAKVYATASAGPISLHGGYIFDIGSEREFAPAAVGAGLPGAGTPLFTNGNGVPTPNGTIANARPFQTVTALSTSDSRNAYFLGADFDYPIIGLRSFGAVDYYILRSTDFDPNPNTDVNENATNSDQFINAMFGLGVKLSVFEIGAALQVQTRFANPTVRDIGNIDGIGSHAVTVAPYLRISPPAIPASIFIKGAVQEEYTEFGYNVAGGNSVKPSIGFTAGLSVGFQ